MKLTSILIVVGCLQASAGSFGQSITFSGKKISLETVFKSIKQQTGFLVVYNADVLLSAKPVTIDATNMPLSDFLRQTLKDQPFEYQIEGKTIVLSVPPDRSPERDNLSLLAVFPVSGVVYDAEGVPVANVTVSVRGSKNSTSTDGNGKFSLNVNVGDVLVFTSIGFEKTEVTIKNTSSLSISLSKKLADMQEFVVTKGYYTTTKALNTGSVGTLKAEDIAKQPVNDPLLALSGRIPGLFVAQQSGVPGSLPIVKLRGLNSIANGTDPLYVIDGIPFNSKSLSQTQNAAGYESISPFTSIRPDDIQSIDVLKDADATAIYGSRSANGVILITTKKGKAGKTKLDVNASKAASVISRSFSMLNTQQYLDMRREGLKNDNTPPASYEFDVNGTWDTARYTDWQKMIIGDWSHVTDAKATVSGGNAQTQFLAGAGYRKETTVFSGDFGVSIASGNMRFDHESENKKFNINASVQYSSNTTQLPSTDITRFIFMAPNAPAVYDANGNINWEDNTFRNPFGELLKRSTVVTENLLGGVTMGYRLFKHLQLKSSFRYNSIRMNETNIVPLGSWFPPDIGGSIFGRQLFLGNNAIKSWIIEPQLNYSAAFGDHGIDALLGATWNENKQASSRLEGSGYTNDFLIENIQAAQNKNGSSALSQYRYNAAFFLLGYNFRKKYVVNLTGRRDGSSRFGPGRQFGNFGSVAAAWLFSKENFIQAGLPFLSFGKLRASAGTTGNEQLPNYQYLSSYYTSYSYFDIPSLAPARLTNPFYGWETISKMEVAMELGFLESRIMFNASFYRNRTSNQLVGYALPGTTGFNEITANLPAVIENKGLELEINTINYESSNFSWRSSFNFTLPKNKLVSYPNIEGSAYASQLKVGMPLTIKWVFKYTGMDAATGLYRFADLNNDGNVGYSFDRYPVFVGEKYFGGFSNTFVYKSLSLDVFLQYAKQQGFDWVSNNTPGMFNYNQPVNVLDRWQEKNDDATHQRYTASYGAAFESNDNYTYSDGNIVDASYIRLKNVALSWNLPFERLLQKIKMQQMRIYVQAQNLLTFTSYKGIDPETQQWGGGATLPPLRVISAGLQLTF